MGLFANLFGKSKQETTNSFDEFDDMYKRLGYWLPEDNWYVGKEPPICVCGEKTRPDFDSDELFQMWVCPECNMRMSVFNGEITYYPNDDECDTYDYDDVYCDMDDDMNPGCSACDNPNYPMCKDSCPMFD